MESEFRFSETITSNDLISKNLVMTSPGVENLDSFPRRTQRDIRPIYHEI
ncbi:predicted protein [Sclerotinia sclerotiorum 1980 UF-70]|uniref:Uncharacterized protein n=1 Tax=Sclerotinia sclerotiorum (strain ATCC 18683 / 1980 / Ss-1) TaxID=665079 RepID=A7F980_SCLS1|nr:predicted protein [Sclerotinia sclerotiorum 1980 UF-70]EDO00291.1 predicted protein [Sclerotinia sclerotiorum 1980 UF-70]